MSQTLASIKLYLCAKELLGMSMPSSNPALGCVDALNYVVRRAFGKPISNDSSTYTLYEILKNSPDFVEVAEKNCVAGDLILSPTGYGSGRVSNGHCGILGLHGILSNESATGLWREKWTLGTWREYYGRQGGFPVKFYRVQDSFSPPPKPVPPAQLTILQKIVALWGQIIKQLKGK